jgi:hypothetical protein
MKKIILIASLLFSIGASAQKSKDSLLNVMAKEACDDMDKKDFSKMDSKNMQTEIGMMLMPTFMSHASEIEELYGGGITDGDAMKKIGMELGMRLVQKCPKFMELSMKMAGNKMDAKAAKKERIEEIVADETMLNGTLLTINAGDVTTLSVKDNKGKIIKLYWLENFENADSLQSNNKKYINKKIGISYTEKSVFDALKKDYKTIRVITGLNLL